MTVLTYPHVPAAGTVPAGLGVFTGSQFDLPYGGHALIVGGTASGKTSVLGLYAAGVTSKPGVALAIIDGAKNGAGLSGFEPRTTWFARSAQDAAETLRDLHAVKEMRMRVMLKESEKRWTGNEILVLVDEFWLLDPKTQAAVRDLLRFRAFGIHLVITAQPIHLFSGGLSSVDRDIVMNVLALDSRHQRVSREAFGYALGRREPVAESRDFRAHVFNAHEGDGDAFDPYQLRSDQAASIGSAFASYRIPLARV